MFKRLFVFALVFGMAATAPPAVAQSNCAPREIVVQRLSDHFHEAQSGAGLQSDTRLIEVWHSDRTGSWTILLTRANGISCVLASGQNWHEKAPRPLTDLPG